jgi:hypothetical protein
LDELIDNPNAMNKLLEIYKSFFEEQESYASALSFLNFNWEYQDANNLKVYPNYARTRKFAEEVMAQTDVLIITGYSFPIFNRGLDVELFKQLNASRLKKIYVQDCKPNKIINRIIRFLPVEIQMEHEINPKISKIVPIDDVDQLYFPDELEVK